MITEKNAYTTGPYKELCGLSTDTKPTDVGNGSVFDEIDTGKMYLFDGENAEWIEPGSGGGGGGTQTYTVSGEGEAPVAIPEGLSIPDEMTEGFTATCTVSGTNYSNVPFEFEAPMTDILIDPEVGKACQFLYNGGDLDGGELWALVGDTTLTALVGWHNVGADDFTWSITFTDAR